MVASHRLKRRGFTLIELLVVLLIILMISVVALPTVVPALNHRQVSEAGRIVQGAIVGARDQAIHSGQPAGIRLLPDPTWRGINPATGLLDPAYAMAFDRIIPIGPAPEYTEGAASVYPAYPYSAAVRTAKTPAGLTCPGVPCLVLEEAVADRRGAPNSPTSWFWNVRVGDRLQIGGAGPWYTVVGPMAIPPAGITWTDGRSYANAEGFCNNGPPGTAVPVLAGGVRCEYLLLADGRDDNDNGWADEGWDGVDNDSDPQSPGYGKIDDPGEWEAERWAGGAASGLVSVPYAIRRRPMPTPGAREVALPSGMVIDATTWGFPSPERSRIPIEAASGAVDLMVNPDGTAYFAGFYAVPSKWGMASAFVHLWLADRRDVADIALVTGPDGTVAQPPTPIPVETAGGTPHYLPIAMPGGADKSAYGHRTLEGGYAVLTLSSRTGSIVVSDNPAFDDPLRGAYNPNLPFLPSQQGAR